MNNNKNIEQWTEEFNTFAETKEARDYCFGNYNNAARDEQVGLFCYLAARKKAQEEIQKRDDLLDSAKVVMDRCEFGLQPEFYGGKGNGSLKDVRQWLKQYEELKV